MIAPRRQHTIANGLTVVAEQRTAVPAVAVNLWVDVGSRHEHPGRRGLAHLFEHLMFQGSRNVAAGAHAGTLETLGARFNATTSFDRTNYFETVPAHALELALWLEADRMGSLREKLSQRELDTQREVVRNEWLQNTVERPYGSSLQHLFALLFPADHPYCALPIGVMEHLDASTLDDLRDFFDLHYTPRNMVLSIVGDVDVDHAVELAETYFGGIDAGRQRSVAAVTPLAPLRDPVSTTVVADVPHVSLHRGWRAPALTHDDFDTLEVAMTILASGFSSRLRTRLVRDRQLALSLRTFVLVLRAGNSVASIETRLRREEDVEEARTVIDEEIVRLAADGPTRDELAAAVAQRERGIVEQQATLGERADVLSRDLTFFGDAGWSERAVERLSAISAAEVSRLVGSWFADAESAEVLHLPTTAPAPARATATEGMTR